jgi:predicted small lipoprotein YifL
MKQKLKFVLPVLACLLACACGQKGPLFLPGDRSQVYTELPEIDREVLEDAFESDEEEGTRDVPDTERPQSDEDEAEPYIDPASPPAAIDDHNEAAIG